MSMFELTFLEVEDSCACMRLFSYSYRVFNTIGSIHLGIPHQEPHPHVLNGAGFPSVSASEQINMQKFVSLRSQLKLVTQTVPT